MHRFKRYVAEASHPEFFVLQRSSPSEGLVNGNISASCTVND